MIDKILKSPFVHFDAVENFRECGVPRLYRSGHIDNATPNDLSKLQELDIRSEIDLRTPEEIYLQNINGFQKAIAQRIRFLDLFFPKIGYKLKKEELVKVHKPKFEGERDVLSVNIFNIKYRRSAIWKRATLKDKLQMAKFLVKFDRDGLERYVGSKILAPAGLRGLYKDIIDYSGDSLRKGLELLIKELKEHDGNVFLHCSLGKDRTGIMVYLIKQILNVPLEEILNDYNLSEVGVERSKETLMTQLLDDGLTEEFAGTPKEVLQDVHDYIIEKYGSICKYLETIKVTSDMQDDIRKMLTK